nr:hypothetical protein [Myxococcota bacterium]
VSFRVDGALAQVWPAWRAALEARGVAVEVLAEDASSITVHLDGADGARGYASLAQGSDRVHAALGWVASPPSAISFATPCEVPPRREVRIVDRSREAHPRDHHAGSSERTWTLHTARMLDVDDDGRLETLVPIVEPADCLHEVEYAIYVMRGACGHSVGRTLGSPRIAGPARPGGLRELRTERRWAEITDPTRAPGPENVATLHQVETPYVARGGTYRAGAPIARSGICHHCAMSSCRALP